MVYFMVLPEWMANMVKNGFLVEQLPYMTPRFRKLAFAPIFGLPTLKTYNDHDPSQSEPKYTSSFRSGCGWMNVAIENDIHHRED